MKYMYLGFFLGLITIGGLTGCDRAKGKAAVVEMCRKDGGLRINRTVNVRGFLNEDVCDTACAEYLKDGGFEYVDIVVKGPNPSALYGSEGYFRFSRAKVGDSRCEAYEKKVANGLQPDVRLNAPKFKPDECLAIEKLPARPVGIAYSQTPFRQVKASNGELLGVWEHILKDERVNENLATHREYIFTSDWTTALDLSGGGGRVDSDCRGVQDIQDISVPSIMISRVLKDQNIELQ